jgi:hypothetical protein
VGIRFVGVFLGHAFSVGRMPRPGGGPPLAPPNVRQHSRGRQPARLSSGRTVSSPPVGPVVAFSGGPSASTGPVLVHRSASPRQLVDRWSASGPVVAEGELVVSRGGQSFELGRRRRSVRLLPVGRAVTVHGPGCCPVGRAVTIDRSGCCPSVRFSASTSGPVVSKRTRRRRGGSGRQQGGRQSFELGRRRRSVRLSPGRPTDSIHGSGCCPSVRFSA